MKIKNVERKDYLKLIDIWERSVRATHHFLNEEDIATMKPLILEKYFDAVDLNCAVDQDGELIGFCGIHDEKIEMLFISPDRRGRGIGALLVENAIASHGVNKVDVNEQNEQAVGFYKRMGFSVVDRSALDSQGNPYPLLHMAL